MKRDTDESAAELRAAEQILDQRRCRRRREQRISDVISRLLARRGYAQVEAVIQLAEHWDKIVGGAMAQQSQPTTVKNGVLIVVAKHSMAIQELTFRKRELLKKLQTLECGHDICDLRFRVGSFDSKN